MRPLRDVLSPTTLIRSRCDTTAPIQLQEVSHLGRKLWRAFATRAGVALLRIPALLLLLIDLGLRL